MRHHRFIAFLDAYYSAMVDLQTSPRSSAKRKYEDTPPPDVIRSKRLHRTATIQAETSLRIIETPTSPSSSRSASPLPGELSSSENHDPRGPHKAAEHRRESARRIAEKKRHAARWKEWCLEHCWQREDDPGYKQKVGSKEVHRADGQLPPWPPATILLICRSTIQPCRISD